MTTVNHPRLVRRTRRSGLCVLTAMMVMAPATLAAPTERDAQAQLLAAINTARKANHRPPLKLSKVLAKPARRHSHYVARTGNLTHYGADGSPFYVRLWRAGFPKSRMVGENLGIVGDCSTDSARQIVRMWLGSASHKKVLLSKRFRVVGVGVVAAADCSNTAYTADFGG